MKANFFRTEEKVSISGKGDKGGNRPRSKMKASFEGAKKYYRI